MEYRQVSGVVYTIRDPKHESECCLVDLYFLEGEDSFKFSGKVRLHVKLSFCCNGADDDGGGDVEEGGICYISLYRAKPAVRWRHQSLPLYFGL